MSAPISHCLTIVLGKTSVEDFDVILGALPDDQFTVLSENRAIDFNSNEKALEFIVKTLSGKNISFDHCIQPAVNRRKRLLICDMDSTLIGQECINELADFAGVKDHVSEITERAMRGEIDFDDALRERVALLEGLPRSGLKECYENRIHLNEGAKTLATTMHKHGAKTVIVSGGFTYFSERVAEAAGFEHHQANVLLDDGTHLSGKVSDPILGREAKRQALMDYCEDIGGPSAAIAIGDGANDLSMINASGLGVAYYAKPAVAAAAHCAINHSDLTTALYFQGFKDEEFA